MDDDIINAIEKILKFPPESEDKERAIDAFFLLIDKELACSSVGDEMYRLFKKCPEFGPISWMKRTDLKPILEEALDTSDFSEFLEFLDSLCKNQYE
jgi:hypothetical protein